MYKIILKYFGLALTVIIFIIFSISCEDFEEGEYELPALDLGARNLLQDSFYIEIKMVDLREYNENWYGSNIYNDIGAILDSLDENNLSVTLKDSCYFLDLPSEVDTSYILFDNLVDANVVFFFNNHVKMDIIDDEGRVVDAAAVNCMSPESIVASGVYKEDEKGSRYLNLYIRTRLTYKLQKEKYLLRLIITDETDSDILEESGLRVVIKSEI
jgi:hypothetical protein